MKACTVISRISKNAVELTIDVRLTVSGLPFESLSIVEVESIRIVGGSEISAAVTSTVAVGYAVAPPLKPQLGYE